MQSSSDLVRIGTIGEARGLRGEVWLKIRAKDPEFLSRLQTKKFHIKKDEQELVLKPDRIRLLFDKVCCHFEGLDTRSHVEPLKGSLVFLEEDIFHTEPGEKIFLQEVLGFHVFQKQANQEFAIGVIEGFESNGPQDILVVNKNGSEVLIPFVKPFILSIEFEKKKIVMSLPDGLVEVQ